MRNISILLLTALLAGCGASKTASIDAQDAARTAIPQLPTRWAIVQKQVGKVNVGWIATIKDAELSKLVAEAQSNNKDLLITAANLEKSWGLTKQASAALSPTLNLKASGGGSGNLDGQSKGNLNIGLQSSWEIDVWGRIASGSAASNESAKAARADFIFSQHSLAAAVAKSYFIAIEAQRQEKLAGDKVKAIAEISRITGVKFENGITSQQDVSLALADLASANESLTRTQGARRNALRALELLLGRYPGADIAIRQNLPPVPAAPPAGIPSELLERRPDLIAAERRIAASIHGIDQARAAKLPSIGLSSSLGGSSNQLSNLLNPVNIAWQAVSSLLLPIFDGGAAEAKINIATAEQKAAVASYAKAALTAFGEVEKTLDQGVVLRERKVSLALSLKEIKTALRIATLRYEEGETDILDVLSIQQRKFGSEGSLIRLERSELEQFINLNLALGGSWK